MRKSRPVQLLQEALLDFPVSGVSNMGDMSLRRLVYCEFRLGNMPQKGYEPNAQPPFAVTCLPSND